MIAERFARAGALVVLVARTERAGECLIPGTLQETAEAITAAGGCAVAIQANLAVPADRARLIDGVEGSAGRVDILVNNAACVFFEPFEEFTASHYRTMMSVMVEAPFDLSQRVIGGMSQRGEGWILNLTSKVARHPAGPPYPEWSRTAVTYGMCKAALERMSTGLAAEFHGAGIRVNSLGPTGHIITPGSTYLGCKPDEDLMPIEPPEFLPEAALALCSGPPDRTGGIHYSQEYFGAREANKSWSATATF
jgi:NAD(P)-dependent dehydrogenase (short-subunit alcohol dehydrogenase family)